MPFLSARAFSFSAATLVGASCTSSFPGGFFHQELVEPICTLSEKLPVASEFTPVEGDALIFMLPARIPETGHVGGTFTVDDMGIGDATGVTPWVP